MDFIKTYFSAEKSESLLFMLMGLTAILFSVYAMLRWNEVFYKGLAIPLILVGLIQFVVGGTVYFRTDNQIAAAEQLFTVSPAEFKGTETARMQVVMKNFSTYKKVEIAFVVIGILLILVAPTRPFWVGLGVGMLLQGAVMLSLDIFAENRATVYIEHVTKT